VTYETVLAVSNPDLLLRPGMTATADILIEEKEGVLLVPNRALRFLPPAAIEAQEVVARDADPRVWLVRDAEAVAVTVTVGLTNGELTEVTGGDVEAGTPVIVDVERDARPRQTGGGGPFN
jgi:HlyD family secretion protein